MHFKPLDDLSRCRILLSNDDGIDARGIKLLEQELLKLSSDVWVVAPKNEKSGASHAITSDKLRSMQGQSFRTALCRRRYAERLCPYRLEYDTGR